ncbi:MAG: LysM peptidoglycan-binding domain-containing protein [Bacteroidia bacterium]|nr:LysM peptidoglycan-binding domain-containing protein [Bacteroidia bacterium]
MRIYVCKDESFNSDKSRFYQVLLNPDQLQESISIQYANNQGVKTDGDNPDAVRKLPPTFNLSFLFDSTGVVRDSVSGEYITKPVVDQVQEFKDICLKYNGETHEYNYLILVYGKFEAKGRIQNLQITYTHFNQFGEPIRAKATASFIATVSFKEEQANTQKSSPDLTHARTVLDHDTLPLMTERIYRDPSLYLQIARVNGLHHFRKLKPGSNLIFPPIERKNNA